MKRRIILFGIVFATFGLLFAGWQNATAATISYTENFEDDTVGSYPTADWYNFTVIALGDGTIEVANNLTGKTLYVHSPPGTNPVTFCMALNNPGNYSYVTWKFYVPTGERFAILQVYLFGDGGHTDSIAQLNFDSNSNIKVVTNSGSVDVGDYTDGWNTVNISLNYTTQKFKVTSSSSSWFDFKNANNELYGIKFVFTKTNTSVDLETHYDDIEFGGLWSVANSPPVANFTYTVDGLNVSFTDTSTDSDGTITSWQWDFDGDGIVDSTEQNPSHEYASYGTYNVTLTVADDGGTTDSITKTITLSAPSQFDAVTDLILAIMPFMVIISVFGAIIGYVTKLKL